MTTSKPDQKKEAERSSLVVLGTVSALGFELLGFVLAGLFLGSRIDSHFDSEPVGLVVFVFLALAAFGWHGYRISRRYLLDHGEE